MRFLLGVLALAASLAPAFSARQEVLREEPLSIEERALVRTFAAGFAGEVEASWVNSNAGYTLQKRFEALQKEKPDGVEAELDHIRKEKAFHDKPKLWAADLVANLQVRLDEADSESSDFSKLKDALHFAKELQKVANNDLNHEELTPDRIAEARDEYMAKRKAATWHSSFGDEVLEVSGQLFDEAAEVGLNVEKASVQNALEKYAPLISSAGYQTQLGQHKSSYGTGSSPKKSRN
eukprot:TRINITY_DN67810_c0_g1_i1.p1 TRINITY_DN67810_c0_g1~~TRINITY_DN67810_c0_g1_i1.p1  ORF type:complete len:236 (+),score=57.70 TRINITY_DN67810_c0_g1_i1:115-822(+)